MCLDTEYASIISFKFVRQLCLPLRYDQEANIAARDFIRENCIYKKKKDQLKEILCAHISVLKPVRQDNRRHQSPAKDAVAYPRADNFDPARPVSATNRHEVLMSSVQMLVCADVLRQQCCDPSGRKHENEVEERVVVLSVRLLIIVAVVWALLFIVRVVIQGRSRQSTRLDSALNNP